MFFFACWDWECMDGIAVEIVDYEHVVVARDRGANKASSLIRKGTSCNFYVFNENIVSASNFFGISCAGGVGERERACFCTFG